MQQWIVDFTVLYCCLVLSQALSGVAGRGKKVCEKGALNMPEKGELVRGMVPREEVGWDQDD